MIRARLKLAALVVTTVAASALMAWVISDAVTRTQQTAGAAAHKVAKASSHATAESCYATNSLLWHLDSASWSGYQRDQDAAAFLRNGASSAFHKGSAVIAHLADVFAEAAQGAYWQPLVDCQAAARNPSTYRLAVAVPISSVPKQTIQQVLAHPPAPPTSG